MTQPFTHAASDTALAAGFKKSFPGALPFKTQSVLPQKSSLLRGAFSAALLSALSAVLATPAAFAAAADTVPASKTSEVKEAKAPPASSRKASSKQDSSKQVKAGTQKADPALSLKTASANFEARYPKTKVKGFALTPFAGLFEASVGKEVIYFDESARFLLSGRLLDMEQGLDLTEKRLKDLRRTDFKALPLEKAVKSVYGSGKKKLAVFTDVDCPYSRKLSETLEGLKDVTVYQFLFPLESIHPQARAKSDAIWCAKDSAALLKKALKGEKVPAALNVAGLCESPVSDTLKLAASLGIAGTPTLINEKGDMISGALPAAKLQAFIDAGDL